MEERSDIHDWLDAQLTAQRLRELKERMGKDGEFEEEAVIAASIDTSFKLQQKAQWKQLIKEQSLRENRKVKSMRHKSFFQTYRWIAVAASVLILISIFIWYHTTLQPENLIARELESAHQAPIAMRGNYQQIGAWQEIREAYNAEDYARVEGLINKAYQESSVLTDQQRFYMGLAQLYQEKYDIAIKTFRPLTSSPNPFREEANWFQSLALIKQGDGESARKLLERIVSEEQWNAEKARKLLNSMK